MKRATWITLICIGVAIVAVPVILSFTLPAVVWAQFVQYLRWNAPGLIFLWVQGFIVPIVILCTVAWVRWRDKKLNLDITPESRDRVLRANRNADYWKGMYETMEGERDDLRGVRRVARRHAQMVVQDLESVDASGGV